MGLVIIKRLRFLLGNGLRIRFLEDLCGRGTHCCLTNIGRLYPNRRELR